MSYILELEKEYFKFSCAHFTIFSATNGERLHGHNYYIKIILQIEPRELKLGLVLDLERTKKSLKELCQFLDEYILIPTKSPHLQILKLKKEKTESLQVVFNHKEYSFPIEDVRELPLVNISSEELARFLAEQMSLKLKDYVEVASLTLILQETKGQKIGFTIKKN